jgi:hypothetical protein
MDKERKKYPLNFPLASGINIWFASGKLAAEQPSTSSTSYTSGNHEAAAVWLAQKMILSTYITSIARRLMPQ